MDTKPGVPLPGSAPVVQVPAVYKDPQTGALYVHADLTERRAAWAEEQQRHPVDTSEHFGDVESWVAYVTRFGANPDSPPFLTWNDGGLRAILDYHEGDAEDAGRCQWQAEHRFHFSPQWRAWQGFANGAARPQRDAIERLEDLAPDVVDPPMTELMGLLRNLRASVNAKASSELRPDGSSRVDFEQDKQVKGAGGGAIDLPAEVEIQIPVLRGHVGDDGRPVVYRVAVRLRVSVGDDAKLALRFAMPAAERLLEQVYADRVAAAKRLLGEGYALLRAAD
jgi:hypothetical protein